MSKINSESATIEINKWLDYKKISDSKREANKDIILSIVDDICDGTLVLKDDFTFVHTLKFPLENESPVRTLEYKPRLDIKSKIMYMKKDGQQTSDQRIIATIAALTQQPTGVISALDTEDYTTATAIAIFFL